MKTIPFILGLLAITWGTSAMAQVPSFRPTEIPPLLQAYTHFLITGQVQAQGIALGNDLDEPAQAEVRAALNQWSDQQHTTVRTRLEQALGETAREKFETFVSQISSAEQQADPVFLEELRSAYPSAPHSYEALRAQVAQLELMDDLQAGADLLAEIQTWADMRVRGSTAIPLPLWLTRSETAAAPPPPPARPSNPLRAAEAPAPERNDWGEMETSSPLGALAQSREDKRQKVRDQAMAGMQQMAQEREAAEQEYAAKKAAAAQAEADNMRRQAEKLASVEAEALEQRKNSWGNRLKSILGATVQAAVGGFTGGVGTRAASEAVDAIFK
ncbi:MAG: hypothetical protein PHO14_06025 [Kiritimatiellae bacterium]|jgi:chemotaxis protein histidine kinase CheA|nr:hypothetical protein [Kiritimatiellia bacterium]MDD4341776.1 hypothetical protein [Kiritimatiellia bacterium]MDY0150567.1 hypothetical protein [Kiritimatiellia bacterium]